MRTLLATTVLAVAATLVVTGTALAQRGPEFKLGFAALADQIPAVVGEPIEDEHWGDNGDSLQRTTKGLMVWRKADNWTAFTDGSRTWINGPQGVKDRGNDERFAWESPGAGQKSTAEPAPPASAETDAQRRLQQQDLERQLKEQRSLEENRRREQIEQQERQRQQQQISPPPRIPDPVKPPYQPPAYQPPRSFGPTVPGRGW